MVQLAKAFAVVCAWLLCATAQAQKFETIKIIVGYAPEAELPPDVRNHRRRFAY